MYVCMYACMYVCMYDCRLLGAVGGPSRAGMDAGASLHGGNLTVFIFYTIKDGTWTEFLWGIRSGLLMQRNGACRFTRPALAGTVAMDSRVLFSGTITHSNVIANKLSFVPNKFYLCRVRHN